MESVLLKKKSKRIAVDDVVSSGWLEAIDKRKHSNSMRLWCHIVSNKSIRKQRVILAHKIQQFYIQAFDVMQ